ncbi:MAG: 2-dehydro-3-deoxygluconokinase [Pseudomonadota bacterium]
MSREIVVLGEALMDCIAQPDGQLRPLMGGSPYNMARAAALRGAQVAYLNPLSVDRFGRGLADLLIKDGVQLIGGDSRQPTSLAVVQLSNGQPSYGFYREGIADRDYTVQGVLNALSQRTPGIFHTGSLLLIPPEHEKVLAILDGARTMGWTISVDVNLRPVVAPDLPSYVQAVEQVIRRAHWLKASDEDLETLGYGHATLEQAAELAKKLHTKGIERLALTFGGDGAWLSMDGAHAQSPVPKVNVVDTVGAGDTFWGNCLADWAMDDSPASQRMDRTLSLAMAAAAINCSRQGCQPPSAQETLAF